MGEETIPVGNKLHQEIGLDAAVRQRKKGTAKLKAAAELAAIVAAAEARGYENCLAAAKQLPTSVQPTCAQPSSTQAMTPSCCAQLTAVSTSLTADGRATTATS